ncbi:MAG: hypothetical protein IT306_18515 [Chloroflexi bacterium]|nr:hypothetical protein [Chloroflexota bacterium]
MESPRFERVCRTANSEAYLIVDGEDEEVVGRVDLHYTSGPTYGVLIVERDLSESDILELRSEIDDELVQTADISRDDFLLAVYQGQPVRPEPFTDEDTELPMGDALP